MPTNNKIPWNRKVSINGGKEVSLSEWLAENYARFTNAEIAAMLRASGIPATDEAVRSKARRMGLSKPVFGEGAEALELQAPEDDLEAGILKAIKNKPTSLRELSEQLDRSESTIAGVIYGLLERHYNIVQTDCDVMLDTKNVPTGGVLPTTLADEVGMYVPLGIISDLHAGSKAQQITNLRRFVLDAYERGIRVFLIPGDLSAGKDVYRGQIHDLYARSFYTQLAVLDWTLPKLDGVKYIVLGGNHDYAWIKRGDPNIVAALAEMRDDVFYLGYDAADAPITDRVDARLWHPSGGVPYSVSYRLQKGMEQIAFDELLKAIQSGENPKMRLVLSGHLHVAMTMQRGPIVGMQCGCFEGQTNYLKRKMLFPEIGGYIVELWLTDSGLIQRVRHEWIPFLEIVDDYRNYPELLDLISIGSEPDEIEPLFEWRPEEVA